MNKNQHIVAIRNAEYHRSIKMTPFEVYKGGKRRTFAPCISENPYPKTADEHSEAVTKIRSNANAHSKRSSERMLA